MVIFSICIFMSSFQQSNGFDFVLGKKWEVILETFYDSNTVELYVIVNVENNLKNIASFQEKKKFLVLANANTEVNIGLLLFELISCCTVLISSISFFFCWYYNLNFCIFFPIANLYFHQTTHFY